MMGRPGSGRARKASISFPRSATKSGAGVEVGRQAGLNMFGDFLGSAILGVAECASASETLVAAGNIVRDTRERAAGQHRFSSRDLDQIELRIDADVLAG